MGRFTIPRDIWFGRGSLEKLRELDGGRAIIVTGGGSMRRGGFLQRTEDYLTAAGMEVALIDGVEPDPSVDTVLNGGETMRQFRPDWIVAIGGGSAIDAAKAMWVFYEHPDTDFNDLITPFSFPRLREQARFAAIPSTSGTATEVTAFSVITDYARGIKYPLADYEITPDIAILDPDLTDGMPPSLAAYTGMDALTHAIEAYVSKAATCFTDPLALRAIEMITEALPESFKGRYQAREQMHYAQCLAGMAFSNGLLGITHSLAHKIGAAFTTGHITHGLANALLLPYVINYNMDSARGRYARIAAAAGVTGSTDTVLVNGLVDKIRWMNSNFGIPSTLARAGVGEEEFHEKLRYVSEAAAADACTGSNPRPASADDLAAILTKAYYGA